MRVRSLVLLGMSMAISTYVAAEGDLGRLFLTPEDRARLDQNRLESSPLVKITPVPSQAPTTTPVPLVPLTVNGLVVRKHGANTVWINGANSYDGDWNKSKLRVPLRLVTPNEVPVILPNARGTVRIKPGNTYLPPGVEITPIPASSVRTTSP